MGLPRWARRGILLTLNRGFSRGLDEKRMTVRLLRRVLSLIVCVQAAVPVWAEETVPERVGEAKKQALPASHKHSIERRRAATERRQALNMHQYKDSEGVLTLTNRPEKYQNRREYTEVQLNFEPIYVPKQFQKYTAPAQYSGGNIDSLIKTYAQRYFLDENLIYAVIKAESNFNPNAVSRAGACGLMQLMPATAAEMGVTNIFDPAQNIAGGTQYLAKMLGLFNNDLSLALAGYNAGPESVKKHGGIPPYAETQAYVRTVLANQRGFSSGGLQARSGSASRVHRAPTQRAALPTAGKKQFLVHFHSGLQQPADEVVDKDPYYYIVYGKRTYPVRKELVAKIDEPA